ncbi:MAG: hypothetical protein PHU12_01305 [Candidatus Aenigmarchaeota archaeon]|nr:hypothetical protein [Candidatus Aenigmarchaeota archaeon]
MSSIKTVIFLLAVFLMGSSYIMIENYGSSSSYGSITGMPIGTASVTVAGTAQISLPVSTVSFGTMPPGAINETSSNSPQPFLIQNDGTVSVNVTIAREPSSPILFSGTGSGDNSASFQFAANVSTEAGSFDTSTSIMTWTNMPGTAPIEFLKGLKHPTPSDSAEVELRIAVPGDEPPGVKSEALSFIAYQS